MDYVENETEFFPPSLFSEHSQICYNTILALLWDPALLKNRPINITGIMGEIRRGIFTLGLASTRKRMLALYRVIKKALCTW
jgi:hypothetical protein